MLNTLQEETFTTESGLIGIFKQYSFKLPENSPVELPDFLNTSWCCGYVIVPNTHPYFGKDYMDIENLDVHGGLTFSGEPKDFDIKEVGTVFGFDCNHYSDSPEVQNKEYTKAEIEKLAKQLAKLNPKREGKTMKITGFSEDYLGFDNGTKLETYHDQDCCESVYADFNYLNEMNVLPETGEKIKITDIEFDEDIEKNIEFEEGMGIKLVAKDGSKWFVPCYNYQNGYYSSALELQITKEGIVTKIDISNCVEDHID